MGKIHDIHSQGNMARIMNKTHILHSHGNMLHTDKDTCYTLTGVLWFVISKTHVIHSGQMAHNEWATCHTLTGQIAHNEKDT
jgi:flagellar basal body rod protein FlgG